MKTILYSLIALTLLAGLPGSCFAEEAATVKKATRKNWKDPGSYFTDDVLGAVVVRPKQVWDFPMLQKILASMFTPEELEKKVDDATPPDAPFDFKTIDQLVILADTHMIDAMIKAKEKYESNRKRFEPISPKIKPKSELSFNQDIETKNGVEVEKPSEKVREMQREATSMTPLFVFHLNQPYDKQKWLKPSPGKGKPVQKKYAGVAYTEFNAMAVLFVDNKTVVFGSEAFLKRVLDGKGSQSKFTKQFAAMSHKVDLGVVVDLEARKGELKKIIQSLPPVPGVGMILNIKTIALTARITGNTGDTLLSLDAETLTDQNATFLAQLLNGMLEMGKVKAKQTVKMLKKKSGVKVDDELNAMGKELSKNFAFASEKNHLVLNLLTPKGYRQLPKLLKPILVEIKKEAEFQSIRNNMKMIGLAFHNYHDAYSRFPRANGNHEGNKTGLSWRVHLLPMLDQMHLYKQFHLDEAWDSDHNKKLIKKMPAIFKTPGVKEKGKTAIHVFIGKGAPFESKKKGVRMRDFTDGTSNTILAIHAGVDKADIWTKPGGLNFDAKNPIKAFGKPSETKKFTVLFGDGSVQLISTDISPKTLHNLLRHQDGEVVKDY